MLDLMLLVILAVVVAAVIVAFKIFANLVKAVLTVSAIMFVVSAVLGGIVLKDAIDLKNNFQARSNMLLLANRDSTKLITGIILKAQDYELAGAAKETSGVEAGSRALSDAEIDALNRQLTMGDYAAMLGNNYKLIIINEAVITQSLPQTISLSGSEVPSDLVVQQLEGGDAESRASAFSSLFSLKVGQNPVYILSSYNEGSVIIYPETPALKAIKVIPPSLLTKVVEKIQPVSS